MMSIKWTTVSFLAVATLGAGAFAFGGCTVTSGTPTDPGGTVKDGGETSSNDSGGGGTDAGTDAPTTATCEGNTNQKSKLVSDECQSCLDTNCCGELKACFNKEPSPDGGADGGAGSECNDYAKCIAFCYSSQGGAQTCLDECNAGTPNVVNEYDAIITCAENKGCKTPCGL